MNTVSVLYLVSNRDRQTDRQQIMVGTVTDGQGKDINDDDGHSTF